MHLTSVPKFLQIHLLRSSELIRPDHNKLFYHVNYQTSGIFKCHVMGLHLVNGVIA